MKAIVIHKFGELKSIAIEDTPDIKISGNEVIVAVKSASINPSDVKNVQGLMHGTILPRIPGRDYAGVIVEGAPEFIGREVWGTGGELGQTRDGSHAQFIKVPAAAVVSLPAGLSMQAAGTAGLSYVTAWEAIVTTAAVAPGETVLVIGATGGTGAAAVQIAKVHGARVIAIVRSDTDLPVVKDYGADEAINSKSSSVVDVVKSLTKGLGAELVFDGSGMMFAESIELAAMNGRIPIIAAPRDGKATFNLRTLYRKTVRVQGIDTLRISSTECGKVLTKMVPHFESGIFKVRPPRMMPLASAVDAYELAANGGGRIAIQP